MRIARYVPSYVEDDSPRPQVELESIAAAASVPWLAQWMGDGEFSRFAVNEKDRTLMVHLTDGRYYVVAIILRASGLEEERAKLEAERKQAALEERILDPRRLPR